VRSKLEPDRHQLRCRRLLTFGESVETRYMCGIAGIFNLAEAEPPRGSQIAAMIGALHHRGPDGTGQHLEACVGLGHARLSIIDLAGGAQPIHNEDGTVWVVFNGEIFNYVELRRDLVSRGHRFYTHSDTEVIVHLYEEHGERFVEHLNGQFAIALWDSAKRQLVLARDRVGIRPLFYVEMGSRIAFASEVKALFTLHDVPRKLSMAGLSDIFAFWSPLGQKTVFDGVHSLPPGHLMILRDGRKRLCCYWDWIFPQMPDPHRSEDDLAAELRDLMIDAVRLQLRADVPVGTYLSGGLDSSIITSLIRNHTDTPLRSFSLTFEDAEFDESAHQQALVDHLRTKHSSIRVKRADIAAAFPRTIWHAESAIIRTAPTPLMLLSRHVRESGFKVVLSGEGADEVFGGYDLFKEAKIRRFLAREPGSKCRPRILERLYPYLKHSPAAGRAFADRFFSEGMDQLDEPWFSHIPRITTTRRVLQLLCPDRREQVAAHDPCLALLATLPDDIGSWVPMARDQYVEAHTLLSGYLLSAQGDRVAMANSIEARVPFLDHRVIEFANRLPPKLKLMGLTEKYLLKKSMQRELPDGIRRRTKQPYRAPDSASFFEQGRPSGYVAELLSPQRIADAGIFNPIAAGKLLEKCRSGRAIGFADNMAFVGMLSTMLLHEQFIRPARFEATAAPAAAIA
jgi:asparagine synthase (glutamine-hydrolysing)